MAVAFDLIDDDAGVADLVETLAGEDRYAVDTEFHRERTYYPKLALMQIAWSGGLVLVDPLAADPAPLGKVLAGDGVAVMHAADQDMEVLDRACGAVPARLLDTQLVAAFVGLSSPSLASLVERIVGVKIPKASRLTDWLRRPLTEDQLAYAASDVEHLFEIHDVLESQLRPIGRWDWAIAECDAHRARFRGPTDPAEAWRKIKECRSLKGKTASVARAVAAWREETAAALDKPVRHILPDMAVVTISQRKPTTIDALKGVRGMDGRYLKKGAGDELLDVVADALASPDADRDEAPRPQLSPALRPAIALVAAWLAQVGRDVRIDTSTLATRADIEAFITDGTGRLGDGWRYDLVGEPVRRLVAGDAAVAFEDGGRLVLEARSGEVFEVSLPVPDLP